MPAVCSRHPRNSDNDNNYLIKVFFGISPFISKKHKKHFLKVVKVKNVFKKHSLVKIVLPSYRLQFSPGEGETHWFIITLSVPSFANQSFSTTYIG